MLTINTRTTGQKQEVRVTHPYEHMKRVDEDLIRKASILAGPNNSFLTALELAEQYRSAGLTPVYLLDDDNNMVVITYEEKMNKGHLQ